MKIILVIINRMVLTWIFLSFSFPYDQIAVGKIMTLAEKTWNSNCQKKIMQWVFVVIAAAKQIETTGKKLPTKALGFHKAFMI